MPRISVTNISWLFFNPSLLMMFRRMAFLSELALRSSRWLKVVWRVIALSGLMLIRVSVRKMDNSRPYLFSRMPALRATRTSTCRLPTTKMPMATAASASGHETVNATIM